jgi:hypothetical protein
MKTTQQIDSRTAGYLTTLRRVPDDVILDMGVTDLELNDGMRCVVGWALRASMAKRLGKRADDVSFEDYDDYEYRAVARELGGTEKEWEDVYYGVTQSWTLPAVELAFVLRLDEAVQASKPARRAR